MHEDELNNTSYLITTKLNQICIDIPFLCQARDRMYAMFDSIISNRRSGKSVHQDFLESLIQKHTKNDSGEDQNDKLTDKQLKDNILTLLVAGHDTTTAALTWLIKFLAENPDVLERLRVISIPCLIKTFRLLLLEI